MNRVDPTNPDLTRKTNGLANLVIDSWRLQPAHKVCGPAWPAPIARVLHHCPRTSSSRIARPQRLLRTTQLSTSIPWPPSICGVQPWRLLELTALFPRRAPIRSNGSRSLLNLCFSFALSRAFYHHSIVSATTNLLTASVFISSTIHAVVIINKSQMCSESLPWPQLEPWQHVLKLWSCRFSPSQPSRSGGTTTQQWWILDFLHIWPFIFWIFMMWAQNN